MQTNRTAVIVAIGLFVAAPATIAESISEKSVKDDIVFMPDDDPAMARAFARARETLDDFLRVADNPPSNFKHFAVKVGISDAGNTEYFWITEISHSGDSFAGLIDNDPQMVKTVRYGQRYEFARSEIVDWAYRDPKRNKTYGNFTVCALLSQEPPEEAAQHAEAYGLTCD